MGATTKREPIRNKIPKAQKDYYENILGFKGIQQSDNPFNTEDGSCMDCKNVYVDKEWSLTTRPRIALMLDLKDAIAQRYSNKPYLDYTKGNNRQPADKVVLRMWNRDGVEYECSNIVDGDYRWSVTYPYNKSYPDEYMVSYKFAYPVFDPEETARQAQYGSKKNWYRVDSHVSYKDTTGEDHDYDWKYCFSSDTDEFYQISGEVPAQDGNVYDTFHLGSTCKHSSYEIVQDGVSYWLDWQCMKIAHINGVAVGDIIYSTDFQGMREFTLNGTTYLQKGNYLYLKNKYIEDYDITQLFNIVDGYLVMINTTDGRRLLFTYSNSGVLTEITLQDECPEEIYSVFEQNDTIYLVTSNGYRCISNNVFKEVEGYVPTTKVGVTADSTGITSEDYNLLTDKYKITYAWSFNNQGASLPEENIVFSDSQMVLKNKDLVAESLSIGTYFYDGSYLSYREDNGYLKIIYTQYIETTTGTKIKEMTLDIPENLTLPASKYRIYVAQASKDFVLTRVEDEKMYLYNCSLDIPYEENQTTISPLVYTRDISINHVDQALITRGDAVWTYGGVSYYSIGESQLKNTGTGWVSTKWYLKQGSGALVAFSPQGPNIVVTNDAAYTIYDETLYRLEEETVTTNGVDSTELYWKVVAESSTLTRTSEPTYLCSYNNNIYYLGDAFKLILSGSSWFPVTTIPIGIFGDNIWSYGGKTYYSGGHTHYELVNGAWTDKTWSGLTSFYGKYTWTDGINLYYSYQTQQYRYDTNTNSWVAITDWDVNLFYNYLNGNLIYTVPNDAGGVDRYFGQSFVHAKYTIPIGSQIVGTWNFVNNDVRSVIDLHLQMLVVRDNTLGWYDAANTAITTISTSEPIDCIGVGNDDENNILLILRNTTTYKHYYYETTVTALSTDNTLDPSKFISINLDAFVNYNIHGAVYYNKTNRIATVGCFMLDLDKGTATRLHTDDIWSFPFYTNLTTGTLMMPYANKEDDIQILIFPDIINNPLGRVKVNISNVNGTDSDFKIKTIRSQTYQWRGVFYNNIYSLYANVAIGDTTMARNVRIAPETTGFAYSIMDASENKELYTKITERRARLLKSTLTTRFYNQRWMASGAYIFYTSNNDPTYFPLTNYDTLGDTDYDVTGFNLISDSGLVAYTKTQLSLIAPASDRGDGNYDYSFTETKNTTGNIAPKGAIVTSYSVMPLQIDKKGVFTIQQTENVVSEANVVTPITDAIQRKWLSEAEQYDITKLQSVNDLYWTYLYIPVSDNLTHIYVLDNRTNAWYYWEIPLKVLTVFNKDEKINMLSTDGVIYTFETTDILNVDPNDTDQTYVMRLYYDNVKDNAPSLIDWHWHSQIIPLGSVNYLKQLLDTTFILNDDEETDNYGLSYAFRCFRKNIYESDARDLEGDIQYVRSKTVRSLFTRINFLQLRLKNRSDDYMGDYARLRLVGLGFRYRILGANRP